MGQSARSSAGKRPGPCPREALLGNPPFLRPSEVPAYGAIGPVQAPTRLCYEGGQTAPPILALFARQIKHASPADQTCDDLSRMHGLPLAMSSLTSTQLAH